MLTTKQIDLILNIPKAENHIHIEGSIPWDLAFELAEKNKVPFPVDKPEDLKEWVESVFAETPGLNGFMICDRTINSSCVHEEDYERVIVELAKDAKRQNIIYQEFHLDYPLNEIRGIPMEVVMEGYRRGQKIAKEKYGVDIVYIAGLDRTLSAEQCANFVASLSEYLDMVAGIGMDCEEEGHPGIKHLESYKLAKEMGLFLTAHAGEDDDSKNVWEAVKELKVSRIDHGNRAVDDPVLMEYLRENEILCAMCPTSNILTGVAESYAKHQLMTLMRAGVPVSISSDDPPYMTDLVQEYVLAIEEMGLTEDELIAVARNAFKYSIKGERYLPLFDTWVADFHARWQ